MNAIRGLRRNLHVLLAKLQPQQNALKEATDEEGRDTAAVALPDAVAAELQRKYAARFSSQQFEKWDLPGRNPELLLAYRSFNIIFQQGLYYGWPWSAGAFSVERFVARTAPDSVVAESIKTAADLIDYRLGSTDSVARNEVNWEEALRSEARLNNATRAIENMNAGATVIDNMPTTTIASTAFGCNIECKMCYLLGEDELAHNGPYGRKNMSEETWAKVAALLPSTHVAMMTVEGEILVHTRWFDRWLAIAKADPQLKLAFQTNGMIMNQRVVDAVMDNHNIVTVAVSVDGATAEVFDNIRVRAKFDVVLKNLTALIEAKKKLNRSTPNVETHFVMMKENIHELPAYVEKMIALGVNAISASHLIARRREDIGQSLYFDQERADRYILEAKRIAEMSPGATVRLPETFASAYGRNAWKRPACYDPWSHGQILHDGTVWSCCNNAVLMGDVNNEGSFEAVWNNEKYRKLRATVNDEEPHFSACKHCYAMLPVSRFEAHIDTRLLFDMLEEGGRDLLQEWCPGPIDLAVKPGESYVS